MLDPDLSEHTDQHLRDCLGHLHLLYERRQPTAI